jgi:hypothetical protein
MNSWVASGPGQAASRPWRLRAAAAAGVIGAALVVPALAPVGAAAASCGLPSDTVPPQLSTLHLSPTSVDVAKHAGSIAVTVTATDTAGTGAPSGVDDVIAAIAGPDSSQRYGSVGELRLTSGTPDSGTWTGRLRVPRLSPAGTYHLVEADAVDGDGNVQTYTSMRQAGGFGGVGFFVAKSAQPLLARVRLQQQVQHQQARLRTAAAGDAAPATSPAGSPTDPRLQPGWDTAVTVHSAPPVTVPPGGKGDGKAVKKGTLTGFRLDPQTVDTTKRSHLVTATAHISGGRPREMEALFDNVHNAPDPQFGFMLHRRHGRYVGHTRIPEWFGTASYHVTLAAFYFKAGREHVQAWAPDQLAHKGFSHVLRVISGADYQKPSLNKLAITPQTLDTTSAPQSLHETAKASDTGGSGVRFVAVAFYEEFSGPGWIELLIFKESLLHRVGNHWEATPEIGQCVPQGKWHVLAGVVDKAGNERDYTSSALTQIGAPTSVKVTSAAGDQTRPGITAVAAQKGLVTVDFSEGVRNVSTSTLSVYALQPKAERYVSTMPVDWVACTDKAGNDVDCSGDQGAVRSAMLSISSMKSGIDYEIWANLGSVTTQLTDTAGNPMDWTEPAGEFTNP